MEITKQDIDAMSRTIYGEARGETDAGKLAVGHVIYNRALRGGWWGETIEEVCKKEWQFSCWNDDDPNRIKIKVVDASNSDARDCLWAALAVTQGKHLDNTNGSCHYHHFDIRPNWSADKKPVTQIGNHLFYNDVE